MTARMAIFRIRNCSRLACVAALLLAVVGGRRASAAEGFSDRFGPAINPGRVTFDTQVSLTRTPTGDSWAIWKSYYKSKEMIMIRRSPSGSSASGGAPFHLSVEPGIMDAPVLVASPVDAGLWAFWSARRDGRWRIEGRSLELGRWSPLRIHSAQDVDAIKPAAVVTEGGDVLLAWQELGNGQASRVRMRGFAGGNWGEARLASDVRRDSFRPALTARGDSVWLFWDEYSDGEYAVKGRQLAPDAGPIETVSPSGARGQRCLKPVPLHSAKHGLCVAWLKLVDVIGGDGVIDMFHTAHVSVRKDDGWKLVRDRKGNDEGAVMLNGLLPDLRPGKKYPSGYIGRRRHPMLVEADDVMWLVWERKSEHGGGGTKTAGQLIGRPFKQGQWGEAQELGRGLIDYSVARPARVRDGSFQVSGSQIPRGWIRPYHGVAIDLAGSKLHAPDDWRDQFKRVDLLGAQHPPRREIRIGAKTYRLYWADLHCHSGLTGDAEGEPDEIVLYGRDRAKLDVMVLQDNDDVHGCLLTEGEYYLGMLHSQRFTRPGEFIALPGYEWTQRKGRPGKAFDPWKSVYLQPSRNSYPNHRTVIYPSTGGPIVRYTEVGGDFGRLTDAVARHGGILNGQHRTFDIVDSPVEANMEVTSCWGIYIHDAPGKFHGELDSGKRLGFVGTSDSHRRNPGLCGGLTGIWAEELTDAAILDALRRHRCFASNGSKIMVDSRMQGRLSDARLTSDGSPVEFELHVIGTEEILSATLKTNGGRTVRVVRNEGSREMKIRHVATGLPKGDHWFYWEVRQAGSSRQYTGNISVAQGSLAWSSPHFVTVE